MTALHCDIISAEKTPQVIRSNVPRILVRKTISEGLYGILYFMRRIIQPLHAADVSMHLAVTCCHDEPRAGTAVRVSTRALFESPCCTQKHLPPKCLCSTEEKGTCSREDYFCVHVLSARVPWWHFELPRCVHVIWRYSAQSYLH